MKAPRASPHKMRSMCPTLQRSTLKARVACTHDKQHVDPVVLVVVVFVLAATASILPLRAIRRLLPARRQTSRVEERGGTGYKGGGGTAGTKPEGEKSEATWGWMRWKREANLSQLAPSRDSGGAAEREACDS